MINKTIGQILSTPSFDHFTVGEVRAAFLIIKGSTSLNMDEIYNLAYRELTKLCKKGWLTKSTSNKGRVTTFKKTSLFKIEQLTFSEDAAKKVTIHDEFAHQLTSKLASVNSDLLRSLGALESFLEMRKSYPSETGFLTEKIEATKEQIQILKGKVHALEDMKNFKNRNQNEIKKMAE